MTQRIVLVGHGMVGHKLLERLVAPATPDLRIDVLCEEPRAAYDRVHLSDLFSGREAADLSLVADGFFEQHDIGLHVGERATSIDRAQRRITTSLGRTLDYDQLVLATGSYPFVPPVPGRDRSGCFVYRTIEDVEDIEAAGRCARVGAVIGGGLLGLEAAKALRDLGLEVHVVEFAPRLMAVQVDEPGGRILRQKIESLGVRVHVGRQTVAIEAGEQAANRLRFADGTALDADIVVFSAGIRPQDALARACGLAVGPRGGIAVDDYCRSRDPHIFAIGECAAWQERTFGLVAPGYQMAMLVADQLAGRAAEPFAGADLSTRLKLLGVDVASIGDPHAVTPGARSYAFFDELQQVYKKLVVSADHKRLLGAVLVGDAAEYGTLLQTMLNGMALPERPEELILPALAGSKPARATGLAALPDAAQICSCNAVTKAGICAAVQEGCTTLGDLKKRTRAATSCGGCGPLVTQLLKHELASRGMAVDNHLCEHFPHTRQELYHLVRIGRIKDFDALIARHGRGHGCDICKPVAASVFASCWNEHVLTPRHARLQDTNDYFLANIQKDGTYSVVPRIPGGEITPDRLLVLAGVAKKYGLYTKITGGQRIDLFGAHVHQLPLIWRELVDAGFESGHAYGKSMRTVKSCVGSTWCRYGVQDSVGFAIEVEQRYRGLRSPHKIKLAVSGCTRECAEAQSKDAGIIATEKGWNLYVGGNGGMKPRHAQLLAADLDRTTLLRYLDRFFMFYIRTADRLQRTSVWLDNLEGGIDYVRQVVCEDKLGIGAELEAEMQVVIASYECEWKKAIEDPRTLRRFSHFVNSDQPDDGVVFVPEREQIRPASSQERQRDRARQLAVVES